MLINLLSHLQNILQRSISSIIIIEIGAEIGYNEFVPEMKISWQDMKTHLHISAFLATGRGTDWQIIHHF